MFTASRYPELTQAAQDLISVYDQTPGSSGPYANPCGLRNVLEYSRRLTPEQFTQLLQDLHR